MNQKMEWCYSVIGSHWDDQRIIATYTDKEMAELHVAKATEYMEKARALYETDTDGWTNPYDPWCREYHANQYYSWDENPMPVHLDQFIEEFTKE
jgi:hypothetical protein